MCVNQKPLKPGLLVAFYHNALRAYPASDRGHWGFHPKLAVSMFLTFNTPKYLAHRSPTSVRLSAKTVLWFVYPSSDLLPALQPLTFNLHGRRPQIFFGVGGGRQEGVSRGTWFRINHWVFCCCCECASLANENLTGLH